MLQKVYEKKIKNYQSQNKLDLITLFGVQKQFYDDPSRIKVAFGGNRCLGANTEIFDPVLDRYVKVSEIESDFHCLAWDGNSLVVSTAYKPFRKALDDIYEFTLSNGQKFEASMNHLVLTSAGFLPIGLLRLGSSLFLPQSNSELCQSTHALNDLNSKKKAQDCESYYPSLSHSYDGQPRQAEDNGLDLPQLQDDVLRCISLSSYNPFYGQMDAMEHRSSHSHSYQDDDRHSIQDGQDRFEVPSSDILSHDVCKPCKSILDYGPTCYQSRLGSDLQQSIAVFSQQANQSYSRTPYNTSELTVIDVAWKRRDYKWDFEVPIHHNYLCAGAIHHNSGKTFAGSKNVLDKILERDNMRVFCVTVDFPTSVRVQQRKIHEVIPKNKTSYCQYSDVKGFLHDQVTFKNGSKIIFKTFDQKIDSFAADDLDLVWFDEEPPFDIYTECRMRLLDRCGNMIFTLTPVKGVTQMVNELLEDDSIPKYYLKTQDNPYLSQDEITNVFKNMDESERIARSTGKPTNHAGLVYPIFNPSVHVAPEYTVDQFSQIYQVLDPHDRKPWALGWYLITPSDDVIAIKEWPTEKFEKMTSDCRTIEEYAKLIKELEHELPIDPQTQQPMTVIRRIIDPNFGNRAYRQDKSYLSVKQILAQHGLYYEDAVDDIEVGHQKVREYLFYDTEKPVGHNNSPKFFIHKSLRNHIYYMSHYSWDDYEDKVERSLKERPKDKYKDWSDNIRYLLMSEPKIIVRRMKQYNFKNAA